MARIRVADTTDWSQQLTTLLNSAGHQITTDRTPGQAQVEFIDASSPLQGSEDVLVMVVASPEQVGAAIERCKAGAYAFIRRPFIAEEVELLLERALDHQSLAHENHVLREGSGGAAPAGDTVAVARNLAGKPLADIEKQVILSTLEQFKGHRVRTATALGIGVRTLGMKLKRWRDEGEPIIGRMAQSQRAIHVNT